MLSMYITEARYAVLEVSTLPDFGIVRSNGNGSACPCTVILDPMGDGRKTTFVSLKSVLS
jgi:hypothetical protein